MRIYNIAFTMRMGYLTNSDSIDEFLAAIGETKVEQSYIRELLLEIIRCVSSGLTVVCEPNYVDRVYRDTYYTYFATKYDAPSRNCKRLFLFVGEFLPKDIFDYADDNRQRLQECFIGVSVLKPIVQGKIGKTLLDAYKMHIPGYVRTTIFRFFFLGHELQVDGFPYSAQDGEMMTCAETSTWNVIEYFGTRYPEHRAILPSEMLHAREALSSERSLPSEGLSVFAISYLFKTFGFAPRICVNKNVGADKAEVQEDERFHRTFHYYIESGFPLAVAVTIPGMNGHAIVCMGHGAEQAMGSGLSRSFLDLSDYPCVNSADLYKQYVLMDDNQPPYRLEEFGGFARYFSDKAQVQSFVVPLPRHVFLKAIDAEVVAKKMLANQELGLPRWGKEAKINVSEKNPLVFRLFLTSARKFRCVRVRNENTDPMVQGFYGGYPLPKFIWVAEFAAWNIYQEGCVNGEIVIDATATVGKNVAGSVIFIRYGRKWLFHTQNDKLQWEHIQTEADAVSYPMYKNNLSISN